MARMTGSLLRFPGLRSPRSNLSLLRNVILSYQRAFSCCGRATRRDIPTSVSPIEEIAERLDYPEHHAQESPNWNGGYKLIVRLGGTANKKERSCAQLSKRTTPSILGRSRSWLADRRRAAAPIDICGICSLFRGRLAF